MNRIQSLTFFQNLLSNPVAIFAFLTFLPSNKSSNFALDLPLHFYLMSTTCFCIRQINDSKLNWKNILQTKHYKQTNIVSWEVFMKKICILIFCLFKQFFSLLLISFLGRSNLSESWQFILLSKLEATIGYIVSTALILAQPKDWGKHY